MKFLLVAINAKYIHSNLAVYSLKAYADMCLHKLWKQEDKEQENIDMSANMSTNMNIEIAEYTINHSLQDILANIYNRKPDAVGFSCYIWNISMIEVLNQEIAKILPETDIWLGGPEVSYRAKEMLGVCAAVRGVMIGEGEQTFYELLEYYLGRRTNIKDISGICFVNEEGAVEETGCRELLELSELPFPYAQMEMPENRMVYYESSRGCPFSCAYCLSSVEKKLRFRESDLVRKEIQFFLDKRVPQVKFVDRTFNCSHEHALAIWSYIQEHDNGVTNFHFEIAADLLTEEEVRLIKSMRPGLIQLEMGVQSTNRKTLDVIHRTSDLQKLNQAVEALHKGNNVHQHLDLIAGLPYEDYESFRQSFHDVYEMKPHQLQLGFLKMLAGTELWKRREEYGIVCQTLPPYEVLFTDWLSYEEIRKLKGIEQMLEIYYNSMQFQHSVQYLVSGFSSAFECYEKLSEYYKEGRLQGEQYSRADRCTVLLEFAKWHFKKQKDKTEYEEHITTMTELLVYDLYLRENLKARPSFAQNREPDKKVMRDFYIQEEKMRRYLLGYDLYQGRQLAKMTHLEHFSINPLTLEKVPVYLVFDYRRRSPLTYEAYTICFLDKGGICYEEGTENVGNITSFR